MLQPKSTRPLPVALLFARSQFVRCLFIVGAICVLTLAGPSWDTNSLVMAQTEEMERLPTEDLLPETTVLFVQFDDLRQFATKMAESSVGRFMQDEAVAPLVGDLWGEAESAYSEFEDKIGFSLEDLKAFPAGELTFALIVPRRKDPEYLLVIELDEESESVDRILDRGRELVRESGTEIESESGDDEIEFESFTIEGKKVRFFRKDGLMVGSTSDDELDAFIERMNGREVKKVRALSENRKFITIMNRCLGTSELKPEARIFVDPIAIAKGYTRGNFAAQAGLNFLPIVGLDGLLGIGGSMLLSEEDFESVVHGHILLAEPRKGVFEMLAFKPTDYRPESWLPADITNYFTTSWDVPQMLAEFTKMYETFTEEGAVDEFIQGTINQELELDFEEEILGALTGRVTLVQWMEPPTRLTSQVNIIALELKDPSEFEGTLETIIARINRDSEDGDEDRIEETEYKGVRIFGPSIERLEEQMQRRRDRRAERRAERGQEENEVEMEIGTPAPSFALVGNYLLMSPQSREFMHRAIETHQGDNPALVDTDDYKAISSRMTKMLGTDMPSGITFARPVETFRWMFELAKTENSKALLDSQAENNKYVGGIKRAMDDNPLPDFADIEHYFQPQGGFMTSDDTGFHFLVFEMKAEDGEDE